MQRYEAAQSIFALCGFESCCQTCLSHSRISGDSISYLRGMLSGLPSEHTPAVALHLYLGYPYLRQFTHTLWLPNSSLSYREPTFPDAGTPQIVAGLSRKLEKLQAWPTCKIYSNIRLHIFKLSW